MDALLVIGLIVFMIGKLFAGNAARKKNAAEAQRPASSPRAALMKEAPSPLSGTSVGGARRRAQPEEAASPLTPGNARRGRRGMQTAQNELWRAAKRQQDDAEEVHSVRMDSCESRLENLRVLYDAGILDREEYAARVARVRANHARAAQE